MTRKITILAAALMMLFTFVGTRGADAQCTTRYNDAVVNSTGCINYPAGGFNSAAAADDAATPAPSPTSAAVVSADTVAATTGTTTSGGNAIAFTGSESTVLGYVGAGLIGFGAVALVAARRKENADLD